MTHDNRRGSEMALRTGVALSTLSLDELWTNYRAVGGNLTQKDLSAALVGALRLSPHDHDQLAQVLNDHFTRHHPGLCHRVAYSHEL
ncbi:MAG TPA: hypothetical protein VGP04_21870 [Pseudonocardiaceae bacterium]|nr:hypothetical protein [Pseudonocardiaceae bacterium]